MISPDPKHRWHSPTPGILLALVLAAEGVLFIVNLLHWIPKGWSVLIAVAAVGVFLIGMLLWFVVAVCFQWRFQFSIRTILVLMVAVAIPSSWLAMEMKRAREQREAVEAASFGIYDCEKVKEAGSSGLVEIYACVEVEDGLPSGLEWLRHFLGKDFFLNVIDLYFGHQRITDANLESLEGLYSLQQLDLSYTEVTDTGAAFLNGLTQLQSLRLESTEVGDAGLKHLRGLTNLQKLNLMETKLTDAGLQHLQSMNQLQQLDLRYDGVTDAGLRHLTILKGLQLLRLTGTRVTDDGVKKLQQALPNCKIEL